jgi:PEGA domain
MFPTPIDGPVSSTDPIDLPVGRGSGSPGAGPLEETGGDPGAHANDASIARTEQKDAHVNLIGFRGAQSNASRCAPLAPLVRRPFEGHNSVRNPVSFKQMTRTLRQTLGAALSLTLAFPAAPLFAGHGGGSHGGGSHSGGSHVSGSHSGGSHGSGTHSGSHSGRSHSGGSRRGSGHSGGNGRSHGRSRSSGEWIFFGAPFWGGLGWWSPDAGPYVEAPDEYTPDDREYGPDGTVPPDSETDESDADEQDAEEPEVPEASDLAMLTFAVQPDDAAVYVDGHLLGTAEEVGRTLRGVPVSPGTHTISVTGPGLREWSSEVEVATGESRKVEVSLQR